METSNFSFEKAEFEMPEENSIRVVPRRDV
jgi:hypothetical protein